MSIKINNDKNKEETMKLLKKRLLKNDEVLMSELDIEKTMNEFGDLYDNKIDNLLSSVYSTSKKAVWICDKSHGWTATIYHRFKGGKCPYCEGNKLLKGFNDFETIYPDLAKEWHQIKNKNLEPSMILENYKDEVWWECKAGHRWKDTIENRVMGNNCPYCSGLKLLKGYNDLETKFPIIAKQWHDVKNNILNPSKVLYNCSEKYWWKCPKCNFEWQDSVKDRVSKGKCPNCKGISKTKSKTLANLTSTHKKLSKEWNKSKNKKLKPYMFSRYSNKTVWWKCICCKHEWEQTIIERANASQLKCPNCGIH